MENNNQNMNTCNECAHGCGCGWHHHHGHRRLALWFIKIAVLVLVFSFAFKMGELKGMLESGGYYHHGWGGYPGGMMYGSDNGYWDGSGTTTPDQGSAAPTAPAPKVQ